jgi:hypothetical protein
MRFKCPDCGKILKVPAGMEGRRGRCPGCKSIVTLPASAGRDSGNSAQKTPAPPPLPTPDHVFDLEEEKRIKTKWQLSLYADKMTLQSQEANTSLTIFRDDAANKIKMTRLFIIPPLLVIKDSKAKLNFRTTSEQYDILSEWIGKEILLIMTLKQKLSYCIPIGILYILASLPMSGDPESGLDPAPFSPISFGLGVILILISILTKIKPHPVLFLVDSMWFFILMCYTVTQIFGGASVYWWIAVIIQAIIIVAGIMHYKNFSPAGKVQTGSLD